MVTAITHEPIAKGERWNDSVAEMKMMVCTLAVVTAAIGTLLAALSYSSDWYAVMTTAWSTGPAGLGWAWATFGGVSYAKTMRTKQVLDAASKLFFCLERM